MNVRKVAVGFLLVVLALGSGRNPSVALAGGRAFEIGDYYGSSFVGPPNLSPDGREVVFTVRLYDMDAQESWTNLWRMNADGSDLQQLTFGRKHNDSPTFSSDGKWIYFTSDRDDDGSEIYRLSTGGGEAEAVTDSPLDLQDPVLSPDGRWIAVTADVYPDCGADEDCNESRDQDREDDALDVHMTDTLLYRHWTSWGDGKVSHILLVDAATGAITRDLSPGEHPTPTFSAGGARGYCFSPDSRQLCYVSNHDGDQAGSTNADLWLVDIDDGAEGPTNLTPSNNGFDGAPLYSPDGKQIAFLSQETASYEADLYRLATCDLSSGEILYHTSRDNFDNLIAGMRWAPDSKTLYFEGDVNGRGPIYSLDLRSDTVRQVHSDGVMSGWEISSDGKWLVYTRSHIGTPSEIFRVRTRGGEAQELTHFNDDLVATVDFRPAEEIRVPSGRGYDIQCWIIKPHDFDPARTYPLILNVHGGPQGSWNDRYRGDWQVYPGKGYVVAMPNPTGSTGFGQDYTDAISGDWGGRVFEDLMTVTDALAELPYVDAQRMGSMGWSYGGYMMMWMQGHTDRFVCQASMMGLYDLRGFHGATEELWFPEHDLGGTPDSSELYEKWSPSNSVARFSTPALVITGEKDYRVPYTQSLSYFTALQRQSVPSRLIVFPDSGHWPNWHDMIFYYNAHLDWFHRYLGGGAAPYDMQALRDGRVFDQESASDGGASTRP